MHHLQAPIGLKSPCHPIVQILLYNDLWHNRSLSVTLGDRAPPIGLWLLPQHLIAGQSADRSAPRAQQETEMGQVQIYDPAATPPTPSDNTPRALNQGRLDSSTPVRKMMVVPIQLLSIIRIFRYCGGFIGFCNVSRFTIQSRI